MSNYVKIECQSEALTDKQKSDLDLAEALLEKINTSDYSKRPNWIKTHLRYDGEKFYPEKGTYNQFVSDDINSFIESDFEEHLDFIYSIFKKEILNFKKSTKLNKLNTLKDKTEMLLEYYSDYPVQSNYSKQYSNALSSLKERVEKYSSENK